MGICSSKIPEKKYNDSNHKQTSEPVQQIKESNDEPSKKKQVAFNVQEEDFKINWEDDSESILKMILSDGMFFKLAAKHPVEELLSIPIGYDSQYLQQIAQKIGLAIQDLEDAIYMLKSKVATELMGNFTQWVFESINELAQENLTKMKDKSIPIECTCLTTETYHILNHYLHSRQEPWFQEEGLVLGLKTKFMAMQGRIKLEMISTFGKVVKKAAVNNPLMPMRFNTKHAFGIAKQQTLKEQKQQEEFEKIKQEVEICLEEIIDQVVIAEREEADFNSILLRIKQIFQIFKFQQTKDNNTPINSDNAISLNFLSLIFDKYYSFKDFDLFH